MIYRSRDKDTFLKSFIIQGLKKKKKKKKKLNKEFWGHLQLSEEYTTLRAKCP